MGRQCYLFLFTFCPYFLSPRRRPCLVHPQSILFGLAEEAVHMVDGVPQSSVADATLPSLVALNTSIFVCQEEEFKDSGLQAGVCAHKTEGLELCHPS